MDGVRLTGLWREKDKNGNTYLTGNLNGITRLFVMPNSYKKGDKDPDYYLYVRPQEKKPENKKQPQTQDAI